jgi:monoamine oxidase
MMTPQRPHRSPTSQQPTADVDATKPLDAVAERFGDKALSPVDYLDQNWGIERYSGGGMISHTPPRVLPEFGPALREPCGRIHWAGTETSAKMYGFIDGAVRSCARAAIEVTEREARDRRLTRVTR